MVFAYRKQPADPEVKPWVFRTYDASYTTTITWYFDPGKAGTTPIWQVARATSAAPTLVDLLLTYYTHLISTQVF